MSDVWIITSGDYSAYSVTCACPTREDAEILCERMNAVTDDYHEDYSVERLAMCDRTTTRTEISRMQTDVNDDGTTENQSEQVEVEWPFGGPFRVSSVEWRWVRAPVHNGVGGRLEVWGTDHERVRKVFGDKRAQLMTDDAMRARKEIRG